MALTEKIIRDTPAPVKGRVTLTDQNSLQLRITPSDARTWSVQYRHAGRMLKLTLGAYPAIPLKMARQLANGIKVQLAQGIDPQGVKRNTSLAKARCVTFKEYFHDFEARHLKTLKPSSAREYSRVMNKDILPYLGKINLEELVKVDIIRVVDRIDKRAPILANRALQYISKFLNWCVGRGYIEHSPAHGIPKPQKERSRTHVPTLEDMHTIYINSDGLLLPQSLAIKLLILTGLRKSEVANLKWSEVFKDRIEIEADRSKNNRKIMVPITSEIQALLAMCDQDNDPYVFSTTKGQKPISLSSKVKNKLDILTSISGWRYHDFRRAIATHLQDVGINHYTIQRLLNHTDKSVTGIYARSELLDDKLRALSTWENLLFQSKQSESVIPFRSQAAPSEAVLRGINQ